jgi:basic amino acid/polyamine antiporter, APA family
MRGIHWGLMGYAMVFVLLTYGGWNEAAYLSAEVRGDRRSILRVLLWGIGIITVIYLLTNAAYVYGMGLEQLAGSTAVAADLMRGVAGTAGANFISVLVVVAALSTINATIITGARTNYALGRDFRLFRWLGHWEGHADSPRNALIVQGAIALALVALGGLARGGFTTMVDYTAPVFWFFFLLVGISVIVLRLRDPGATRPFRVPLYPITPILFCIVCLLMLYSSLNYTGIGALVGVAVLVVGVPMFLVARVMQRRGGEGQFETNDNPSLNPLTEGKEG